MPGSLIFKIVSGGQTGVDRAALDVAIYLDIPHGGWCPAGRRSESGRIPDGYLLQETRERDYSVRTEKNVIESDGTLILFVNRLSGGTELTSRFAKKHIRPLLCIDLEDPPQFDPEEDVSPVMAWILQHNIGVLNVAGPRESSTGGIARMAEAFLVKALSPIAAATADEPDQGA